MGTCWHTLVRQAQPREKVSLFFGRFSAEKNRTRTPKSAEQKENESELSLQFFALSPANNFDWKKRTFSLFVRGLFLGTSSVTGIKITLNGLKIVFLFHQLDQFSILLLDLGYIWHSHAFWSSIWLDLMVIVITDHAASNRKHTSLVTVDCLRCHTVVAWR
jgi:hypothetical protein